MRSAAWLEAVDERLRQQRCFIVELDRLKSVARDTPIINASRLENSAEHSWHLAMLALTLTDCAAEPVDIDRVLRMLLVHDIVEIDAGDASILVHPRDQGQKAAERGGARRIFGLLPEDTANDFEGLWLEFEAAESSDARFARALDSLQPLILNHAVGGGSWTQHRLDEAALRSLKIQIMDWAPRLWEVAEAIFADAVDNGWLLQDRLDSDGG